MNDSDHEFQHYYTWERAAFAKMDAAVSSLAAVTGLLLATGVIPADVPLAASSVLLAFAVWPGWAALKLRAEHRELTADLREQGCTDQCWTINGGLQTMSQAGAR
ncbi:hypothetical protein [Nocardia fluminea]|uniref:hypothetical protein n=1 Tax=Nocardia fluminea TaxID=134984 RepID=UPI003D0F4BFC